MRKKITPPKEGESVVTIERINQLVDAIVPLMDCEGPPADVVALALAELVDTLTNPRTKYASGEDGHWLAYFVARRAFKQTGKFEDAFEDWRDNRFESALKKGGAR